MSKKLNLGNIKIKSFVTSLEKDEKNKIKGGVSLNSICCPDEKTYGEDCPPLVTDWATCASGRCWCA